MFDNQLDPDGFDTGAGSFDTDETRVFARLADARHPVPPCLLTYGVEHDANVTATPGRCFTERVRMVDEKSIGLDLYMSELGCKRRPSFDVPDKMSANEELPKSVRLNSQ